MKIQKQANKEYGNISLEINKFCVSIGYNLISWCIGLYFVNTTFSVDFYIEILCFCIHFSWFKKSFDEF